MGQTAAFEQNVFSVARLVRKIAPGFQKQGWGRVIQIASGVATMPFPIGPEYAAAKAAIVNATVSLAKSLGGTGVTVNTVSPGPIRTEALERVFRGIAKQSGWGEDWAEIEKQAVKNLVPNPTGRIGTVEDIANAVAFLASPLAGYVNGANLRVDGGYVTTINQEEKTKAPRDNVSRGASGWSRLPLFRPGSCRDPRSSRSGPAAAG